MSAAFALTADLAMAVVGSALKRKESLSARLGDVLSYLYLASAALKRFEDQGRPPEDAPLLQWACEESLYTIQDRLDAVLRNFPNRAVAGALRLLIFPVGRRFSRPDDRLGHRVASLLLEPSAARDRLTAGIYVPTDASQAVGRLDATLVKIVAAEAAENTLRAAIKAGTLAAADEATLLRDAVERSVIGKKDADAIRDAAAARREAIQVDDFPPDYWRHEAEPPRRTVVNR
jgi:acyl-CoA dehydrogenase